MAETTERELRVIGRAIADPRRFEILRHIARTACMNLRTQSPITAALAGERDRGTSA